MLFPTLFATDFSTVTEFKSAMSAQGYRCLAANYENGDIESAPTINFVYELSASDGGVDSYLQATLVNNGRDWTPMFNVETTHLDEAFRSHFEHILLEQRDIAETEMLVFEIVSDPNK